MYHVIDVVGIAGSKPHPEIIVIHNCLGCSSGLGFQCLLAFMVLGSARLGVSSAAFIRFSLVRQGHMQSECSQMPWLLPVMQKETDVVNQAVCGGSIKFPSMCGDEQDEERKWTISARGEKIQMDHCRQLPVTRFQRRCL